MEKNAVPKFGSFQPKRKPELKQDPEPQRRSAERGSHDKTREHSHSEGKQSQRRPGDGHNRQRPHYKDHHESREDLRESDRKRPKIRDAPRAVELDEFEESDQFVVDRRGDAKNVAYGSLHRYSVPAYRRTGYGNVVGLSLRSKIDREESDEKEVCIVPSAHQGQARQRASRVLSSKYGKGSESRLRFVAAQNDHANDDIDSDYIEIKMSRRQRHGSADADDYDQSVDYRSIAGKAKANSAPSDDDLEAIDSDDNLNTDLELRTRQESAVLSKKAKSNPTDLEAWLTLAKHQSRLVRPGADDSSLTSSERRTLADLKLSIYNEASRHISTGKPGRERLITAIIDEGGFIWDKARMASKWREALTECPTSILLWTKHLDYVQDSHSTFRYEKCKDAYVECLKILQGACKDANDTRRVEINTIQLYVLLRFTTFVRESGYDELAIAIWQALIELHFFVPSSLSSAGTSERLASLEHFWESEVARVGEESSLGWAKYCGSIEGSQRKSQPAAKHKSDASNPLQNFANEEEILGHTFQLPAPTYDDEAVADPFRCVMFSDIGDIVKPLSANISPLGIIQCFLHFMGLPSIPRHSHGIDTYDWQRDMHLAARSDQISSCAASLRPHELQFPCRRETTSTLFDDAFDACKSTYQQNYVSDVKIRFIDRVLGAVMNVDTANEGLAEYYIAFKAKFLESETSKAAKRILKEQPSSLRLYNAYALAEARAGHIGKASEIWSAALSMRSRVESARKDDFIRLLHGQLIFQVYNGDDREALQLLLATIDDHDAHSRFHLDLASEFNTRQLRLLRYLEAAFDRTHLAGQSEHAVLCADLLACFSYLTTEHDVNQALRVYSKYIVKVSREKGSIAIEQLHQCKARLIKTHIERHRPHKPSVLRQELEDSLELFPNNSIMLELHAFIAAQDRIRALVREQKATTLTSSPSVVQWSFRIAEEIRRSAHEFPGSTSNTVRAAFTKALLRSDSTVSHSPALWQAWLRYEYGCTSSSHDPKAMQRAKQVFLDGLRYLPWMKWWVIQGLKLFGGEILSHNETRQVYELMNERGLRVRVDIEESL